MKKFKEFEFEGKCIGITKEGKGIVKCDNLTGYIDAILPDEEAIFLVTFVNYKSSTWYGKVKKLLKTSEKRVYSKCPIYKMCGGCALHHMRYEDQLLLKQRQVQEYLDNEGVKFKVEPTIGMDDPYHYRNKIQMPLQMSKGGKIISGFYKENTHEICPIDECVIENQEGDRIIKSIKEVMKKVKVAPYDEDRRTGVVRHILIRVSRYYKEVMVVLITNCDEFPGRNNFVKELRKVEPGITTIVQNINTRDTNVILGQKERVLFGKGFIKDKILDVEFKISPMSFYQVNPVQVEKLYQTAIDLADLKGNERVLDAYCGIGTIGLCVAKKAKEVIGVEIVKQAVIDAKNNAISNNIKNASFFEGDAGEFITSLKNDGIDFDVVFMDPPRKGSDEKFLNTIIQTKPKKVVYISCGPESLARDLKYIQKYYDIKRVIPVEMFPFTSHVETIVLLEVKQTKK